MRGLVFLIALTAAVSGTASAQVVNLLPSGQSDIEVLTTDKAQLAVSAGANATTDEAASGVLGFQYWKEEDFLVRIQFNLGDASIVDRDGDAPGEFLLSPGFLGRGVSARGNKTIKSWEGARVVGQANLGATFADWQTITAISDGAGGAMTVESSLSGFVAYVDVGVQIISKNLNLNDNIYALGGELALAYRRLGGAILDDSTFREAIYGTSDESFGSVELTLFARLDNVAPFVKFASFNADKDVVIGGFTGLRAYLGVDVAASMFRGEP